MDSLESILLVVGRLQKNKKQTEGDTTAKYPSRMNTGAVRRNLFFFLVFFVNYLPLVARCQQFTFYGF